MKSRLFVILTLASFCFPFEPARSEVIHGTVGMPMSYDDPWGEIIDAAFDFSTRTITKRGTGDLSWRVDTGGVPVLKFRQCYAKTISGITLEELQVAPPIGGSLLGDMRYDVDVYVVQTSDGLYVKFRNLGYVFDDAYYLRIEYYVQTDGTPNFGPPVVEPTTWGQVKDLYR